MASHSPTSLDRIAGVAFGRIEFEDPNDANKATVWVRFTSTRKVIPDGQRLSIEAVQEEGYLNNDASAIYFNMPPHGIIRIDGIGQTRLAVDHQLHTGAPNDVLQFWVLPADEDLAELQYYALPPRAHDLVKAAPFMDVTMVGDALGTQGEYLHTSHLDSRVVLIAY